LLVAAAEAEQDPEVPALISAALRLLDAPGPSGPGAFLADLKRAMIDTRSQ